MSNFNNPNVQDWTTIVFRKKPTKTTSKKPVAGSGGDGYMTIKKATAGTNSSSSSKPRGNAAHLRKIENTEIASVPKVSSATRTAISQGRSSKGLTQKDLAQKLNVKQSIIQDYENGKAIPDARFLARMEKILDTKLNGLK